MDAVQAGTTSGHHHRRQGTPVRGRLQLRNLKLLAELHDAAARGDPRAGVPFRLISR